MAPSLPFFRQNKPPATNKSTRLNSNSKPAAKRNTSILQFFKKVEAPPRPAPTQNRITQYISVTPLSETTLENRETGDGDGDDDDDDSLFFPDLRPNANTVEEPDSPWPPKRAPSPGDAWARLEIAYGFRSGKNERFHESCMAVKKRRLEDVESPYQSLFAHTPRDEYERSRREQETPTPSTPQKKPRMIGPFVIDSDVEFSPLAPAVPSTLSGLTSPIVRAEDTGPVTGLLTPGKSSPTAKGSRDTGLGEEVEEMEQIEELEELGEMGEMGEMEEMESIGDSDLEEPPSDCLSMTESGWLDHVESCQDEELPICPVCSTGLEGLTDSEASLHVNQCLDGDPIPTDNKKTPADNTTSPKPSPTRAELKAMARPGQRDPFAMDSSTTTPATSAFSKLMSGNAEASAWAVAAANEVASRGKQAYERTCPFYKIMPGFSICVDAFRYGAVEGCSAYFLSHFHSDHYIGLNSNWSHGPIYCSKITGNLVRQQLKVNPKYIVDLEFESPTPVPDTDGVTITMISANHCPGSSLFLFEKEFGKGPGKRTQRILHCGDFRACPAHVLHPLLRPEAIDQATGKTTRQKIDVCYLDTTYLNPKYAFPFQDDVIDACARMCVDMNENRFINQDIWQRGKLLSKEASENNKATKPRLLVVIGTYSIGKERICVGIAKALGSKIYATSAKQRICACLEDPELSSLLTNDPLEAQVHMHSLMEIRADTLSDYLATLKPRFTHVVGFRPTGWSYRPPAGRSDSPTVSTILNSEAWKARFTVKDLSPQRGSTKESSCFGVPYSEHSSFRELTMFCCALNIGKVIPTVNVGSRKTREKMKIWIDRWEAEKRKVGLFRVEEGATRW